MSTQKKCTRTGFTKSSSSKKAPGAGSTMANSLLGDSAVLNKSPLCILTCHTLPDGNSGVVSSKFVATITDDSTHYVHESGSKSSLSDPKSGQINEESVIQYLKSNPKVMGKFIIDHTPWSSLLEWTKRKEEWHYSYVRASEDSGQSMKRDMGTTPMDLLNATFSPHISNINNNSVVSCLLRIHTKIAQVLFATGSNVYIASEDGRIILVDGVTGLSNDSESYPIGPGTTLAAYVAVAIHPVRINGDGVENSKYPMGIPNFVGNSRPAIAIPIFHNEQKIAGVIELYKEPKYPPFTAEDEFIAVAFSVMTSAAVALSKAQITHYVDTQHHRYIQNTTRELFEGFRDMESVIQEIMKAAKELTQSERTAVFIFDAKQHQLYSRVLDVGSYTENKFVTTETILKFAADKGIAGHVVATGQAINVRDAYNHPKFNSELDKQTGFKTFSILAMPVAVKDKIYGVVEMINKKGALGFTKHDEEVFRDFATYCGLAIKIARMYEQINRTQKKYQVALEMLCYHSALTEAELVLPEIIIPKDMTVFTDFYYSPWTVPDDDRPGYSTFMINDTLSEYSVGIKTLFKFVLTVRRNYRQVPYHNWAHAFSVLNAIYSIVKSCRHSFSKLECIGLVVSGICHDLDHRGKTNQFIEKFDTRLAVLYSTSIMERHHFHMTISILQRDGLNIFQKLNSDQYKEMLQIIQHCILATDLSNFFHFKAKLGEIIKENFSWTDDKHRKSAIAICMTASDLCSMYKPWDTQLCLVMVIMTEFWDQGDEEKANGLTPIQMMDRDYKHELPNCQIGFIKGICLPAYTLLAALMPQCSAMVNGANANLNQWEQLAVLPEKERNIHLKQLQSKAMFETPSFKNY